MDKMKMKIIVFMMMIFLTKATPTFNLKPSSQNYLEMTEATAPYPHQYFDGDKDSTPGTRYYSELSTGSTPQMNFEEKSNIPITMAVIGEPASAAVVNIDEVSTPIVDTIFNQRTSLPKKLFENNISSPTIARIHRQASNPVAELKFANETTTPINSEKKVEQKSIKVISLQPLLVLYNCHKTPDSAPETYPENETSTSTVTRLVREILTSTTNLETYFTTNESLVKTSATVPGTEADQEAITKKPFEEPSTSGSEQETSMPTISRLVRQTPSSVPHENQGKNTATISSLLDDSYVSLTTISSEKIEMARLVQEASSPILQYLWANKFPAFNGVTGNGRTDPPDTDPEGTDPFLF